jgi:hypothetical protein
MPYIALSNKSSDLRIEALAKARHNKELELAGIIEKIEIKEHIVDSMMIKAESIYPHCITTLNAEERKAFYDETISLQINFQKYLANHDIDKQFFDGEFSHNQDNICELKRMKYLLITGLRR